MCFEMEDGVLKKYRGNEKEVVIPDGVEKIKSMAFYGDRSLEKVVIPDSVTEIGWEAFRECTDLKSVIIGKGVKKLSDSAFFGCGDLEHLELPAGLEKVGVRAFHECYSLRKAWVDGKEYWLRDSEAPKPVQLVFDSIEASRMEVVRLYESGCMDEFEYIDYNIAGDGYSF